MEYYRNITAEKQTSKGEIEDLQETKEVRRQEGYRRFQMYNFNRFQGAF